MLQRTKAKAISYLNMPTIPEPAHTTELESEILEIVKLRVEWKSDIFGEDYKSFNAEVLDVWNVVVDIVRKRIFNGDLNAKDVIINLKEIDYLCGDASYSLMIGGYLPMIDMELAGGFGYYIIFPIICGINFQFRNLLCVIYSNLSNYIDKRMNELQIITHDQLKAAVLKKEIHDILRVRAYRHKNCINNFFDVICLQNAFKIYGSDALLNTLELIQKKDLKTFRVGETDIFVFATNSLISDTEVANRFCWSRVNTSRSMVSETLMIINGITGVSESLTKAGIEYGVLPLENVLSQYALKSPIECLSVTSKSIIELRQLVQELSKFEGMRLCSKFRGFSLQNDQRDFIFYRENAYHSLVNICHKIIDLNINIGYQDVQILTSIGLRHELDRSFFLASNFVLEFLIEIPVETPFLQCTFEKYVAPSFQWLPYCLSNIFNSKEGDWPWFYLTRSLEQLCPLVMAGTYQIPEYFRNGVQLFKHELERFSRTAFSSEFKKQQAYIVDLGRAYVNRIEGVQQKIFYAPLSIRFPDHQLLQSKNYWVFSCFGSPKKLLYKCLDQKSRKLVVIKRLQKSKLLKSCINNGELGTLMSLNHNNIVRYIDCFDDNDHWFMVMEYCEDTVKPVTIDDTVVVNEIDLQGIGRQVLSGLMYLHFNHIVHRDIKPGNLLRDGRGFVKIADFGEAQLIPLTDENKTFDLNSLNGTPAFMAPECIHRAKVYPSADIWSLGCVLLNLVTGERPWKQCTSELNILYKLGNSDELPADISALQCSDELKRVIGSMLRRNPEERPTLAQLVTDPFFRDVSESVI